MTQARRRRAGLVSRGTPVAKRGDSLLYRRVVRPYLFRLNGGDAEAAHDRTLHWLANASRVTLAILRTRYLVRAPRTVFGIEFPNPVGLAAGIDKDGVALTAWPALGFGFVEVGTVTRHAQKGNDRPRLFRLDASEAIINRMGFNNQGAEQLAARLPGSRDPSVPLGISLGKSSATPLSEAVADYVASYEALREHGDYFVVNVSSPNTPGLRVLQDRGYLTELLSALVGEKPILVKISPDLTDHMIDGVLQVCTDQGAAGLIATNTTVSRAGLAPSDRPRAAEPGGLSGAPLTLRAREIVAFVHKEARGALPVIGVGGIMYPDDAAGMMDAGADLVQLCTGFIYHGPALVKAVAQQLRPSQTR
jgi:dihydroorotate dehydrogenase